MRYEYKTYDRFNAAYHQVLLYHAAIFPKYWPLQGFKVAQSHRKPHRSIDRELRVL